MVSLQENLGLPIPEIPHVYNTDLTTPHFEENLPIPPELSQLSKDSDACAASDSNPNGKKNNRSRSKPENPAHNDALHPSSDGMGLPFDTLTNTYGQRLSDDELARMLPAYPETMIWKEVFMVLVFIKEFHLRRFRVRNNYVLSSKFLSYCLIFLISCVAFSFFFHNVCINITFWFRL
jgi:hypothetical protein